MCSLFFKPSHFTGQWGGLPGVDLIKLFGANLLALFESFIFSQDRKIMVTLIKWSTF